MAEAEALAAAEGLPPKIADLGIAHGHPHTSKATEQKIDPWSVEAGRYSLSPACQEVVH